ncbi:hypothetical protein FBEOM_5888 [Fusarium beomiforme]|uniref:Uncharacterized protein n=1 Tax=Fusarium beomiforme TaxID=44412 RepID=A0A9P5AK33_9HYPO|nr:hypothetical protein FBEOM_5888 [Fusarium beomiforme]
MSYPPKQPVHHVRASSLKRESPQCKRIALVDSVGLRRITTNTSSGIKVVNNSSGGGRQDNVLAKVPGLGHTYAGTVDNLKSLTEAYKIMPKGKLSIIFAVNPNGSGAPTSTTRLDWSILKGSGEPASEEDEEPDEDNHQQSVDDDETVVAEDEELEEGEAHEDSQMPEKQNDKPPTEETAPPSPPHQDQTPISISKTSYDDLFGLVI